MKWKILLPIFLAFGRSIAAQLREQDENSTGKDDEAAEAIDFAIARVENLIANKPAVKTSPK